MVIARHGEDMGLLIVDRSRLRVHYPEEAVEQRVVALAVIAVAQIQKVAEAASEGSFMGFGGAQVSEAEKATLADIAKALGT